MTRKPGPAKHEFGEAPIRHQKLARLKTSMTPHQPIGGAPVAPPSNPRYAGRMSTRSARPIRPRRTAALAPLLALTLAGCAGTAPTAMPVAPNPAPVCRPASDDQAYAPGNLDVCEIKILPIARILECADDGPAEQQATMNRTFRPLFNYIRDNGIPMTTPVEMRSGERAAMAFHLDAASAKRDDLRPGTRVTLRTLPERTVASLTVRGGYTPERLAATETTLRTWLAAHPDWQPTGPAYAVYWNSPFMPGFLKKSEVHIPVMAKP